MSKDVKYIVIHCTAGRQTQTTDSIKAGWKAKGWKNVGYAKLISKDGTIETLATDDQITNGVAGYNSKSIHICYKGGWDFENKKGLDNRTPEQKKSLESLVKEYHKKYPKAKILGHRDLSPDKDKDGVVEKAEWIKVCPSFEVKDWLKEINLV